MHLLSPVRLKMPINAGILRAPGLTTEAPYWGQEMEMQKLGVERAMTYGHPRIITTTCKSTLRSNMTTQVKTQVSIGPTSIAGWGAAVIGLAPIVVKSVEAGQVAFGGPEKWIAIAGVISLTITQVGRYVQSLKA